MVCIEPGNWAGPTRARTPHVVIGICNFLLCMRIGRSRLSARRRACEPVRRSQAVPGDSARRDSPGSPAPRRRHHAHRRMPQSRRGVCARAHDIAAVRSDAVHVCPGAAGDGVAARGHRGTTGHPVLEAAASGLRHLSTLPARQPARREIGPNPGLNSDLNGPPARPHAPRKSPGTRHTSSLGSWRTCERRPRAPVDRCACGSCRRASRRPSRTWR